jgi:Mn-dependent DtxR family transcriptional regulator
MPSTAVENYLKAVLVRSGEGDAIVTNGVIAQALGVTAGSVTTMVKAMLIGACSCIRRGRVSL